MNIQPAGEPAIQMPAEASTAKRPFVLALRGWVCDRYTTGGMEGASLLARAASARLDAPLREIGTPSPPASLGWHECLAKASPYLREAARHLEELMRGHCLPFIFANRCGVSLATLPAMLRWSPRTKVVWFDAHGDFNTPASTPTGYLGGMVLSAVCGLWDSGIGAGLTPDRIILAGVRDLDPGESKLIAEHGVKAVAAKDGMIDASRLIEAIGDAPVWIHVDTDVADPLYLPAEYRVDNGLRPSALHAALRRIVNASELVGFELAEFEAPEDPKRRASAVRRIMRMIAPVLCQARHVSIDQNDWNPHQNASREAILSG
jgi:arginase/N-omega-hydroxy-L-arginine amidinohydrolase